jgi:hypothetical protein
VRKEGDAFREPPQRVKVALALLKQMRPGMVADRLVREFPITRRTASRDIKAARKIQLADYQSITTPLHAAQQVDRLWKIVDDAEKLQTPAGLRAAIAGIREIVRITGTAAPDELNVYDGGTVKQKHADRMKNLTEDQIRLLALVDAEEPAPQEDDDARPTEH